jgi:glucose/arabinose dehydrogenase
VDLVFAEDGHAYFPLLEEGKVWRFSIESGELDPEYELVLPDVHHGGYETGLFSIALHPDFTHNGLMFASYTTRGGEGDDEWLNVLSRVQAKGEQNGEEEVLLTRPGGLYHNGGRLLIADGHLWWTTGDTMPFNSPPEKTRVAQEDGDLRGKILRLTLDGEPAPDNPWNDHAYTKGHRNVFGIAWDPEQERILITINGDSGSDYLEILQAGGNYGWPICDGACDPPDDDYIDPVWQSRSDVNPGPTGATWAHAAFWWGGFHSSQIYRTSDESGQWETRPVHDVGTVVLAVVAAPDGESLYYTTWNQIHQVGFSDTASIDDDEDDGHRAFSPALPWIVFLAGVLSLICSARKRR